MGDDDPWFRRSRLLGLSPEVKACIDGRLIRDTRFRFESRLRAARQRGSGVNSRVALRAARVLAADRMHPQRHPGPRPPNNLKMRW